MTDNDEDAWARVAMAIALMVHNSEPREFDWELARAAIAAMPAGADARLREALERLIPTIRSVDPETTEAIKYARAALRASTQEEERKP